MVITGWSNIDRHIRHHGIVLSQIQKLIERNCYSTITYQTQNQSGKVRCQYKRIRCVIRIRTPAKAIPCHDCPRLIKMKTVRCDTFGTENSITAMNIGRRQQHLPTYSRIESPQTTPAKGVVQIIDWRCKNRGCEKTASDGANIFKYDTLPVHVC